MMLNLDMVLSTDHRRGLVARSGWEQENARKVLRDLGWEWREELHVLVPPGDVPEVDAEVQAVEALHLHGYRTGYVVGPYGAMRLTLERAEQVFTKATAREIPEAQSDATAVNDQPTTPERRYSAYGDRTVSGDSVSLDGPETPAI
ncbi:MULTISPECIES: hypothetical protein [unclassified Streptomyces]|uniref:hypothetical protein n=1 Tax=unclassified Streptomyces TaxID=2593676 RepID=UPI0034448717